MRRPASLPGSASRVLPLSVAGLALALAVPSNLPGQLDGLPWSSHGETLAVAAVLPFLALLHAAFLRRRAVAVVLLVLAAVKIVLWLSVPPAGLGVRVYDSPQALSAGQWLRTYETAWAAGVSAVLYAPLNERRAFPVEWMNRLYARSVSEPPRYWVAMQLEGYVRVPAGARLVAVARGATCSELTAIDGQGVAHAVPVAGAPPPAAAGAATGGSQVVALRGHLCFSDAPEWSLDLLAVGADGAAHSVLSGGTAWRTTTGAQLGPAATRIARAAATAVGAGLAALLAVWLAVGVGALWRRGIVGPLESVLAVAATALALLLPRFPFDPTGRFQLAVAVSAAGACWLAWSVAGRRHGEGAPDALPRRLLVVAGLPLLAFFAREWWHDIGRVSWMTSYDDWTMYQIFARDIFVHGQWWDAEQRPVWRYQPLYRYLVGLLHTLFGASVVAQRFVDVWAVIAAAAVAAVYARRWTGEGRFALLAAFLYLGCELGWQFTAHIGLGMTEHAALLFLMLAAWVVQRADAAPVAAAAWGGLLGAACVLVRMDYLPVVLALGLVPLALRPAGAPIWRLWLDWLRAALARWRWLLAFWAIVLAAVLGVALRNWAFGGEFLLTPSQHRTVPSLERSLAWLGVLLNAHKPGQIGLPAVILWPAALAGAAALFVRRGVLARFPAALALIMIALVLPYAIYNPLDYVPRKSINVLPWAAVAVSVLAWSAWRALAARRATSPPPR